MIFGKSAAESISFCGSLHSPHQNLIPIDMLNTSNFRDVVDVVDERAQRRPRDFGTPLALDTITIKIGSTFPSAFSRLEFA